MVYLWWQALTVERVATRSIAHGFTPVCYFAFCCEPRRSYPASAPPQAGHRRVRNYSDPIFTTAPGLRDIVASLAYE
jgi:hypothetical protein